MSLPGDYNKALYNKANFYAAWFPVTTPYSIGDYGLIQNGVFQKIGHLDEFNIQLKPEAGQPTSIDLLSEGARAIKTVAGATVADLPSVDVGAKLTYEFTKKNSFVVKATEINVVHLANVRQVADTLAVLRREKKWSYRYRVVSAVYTGRSCLVLLATEAGTKVEFEATSKALQQLNLGNVEIKPSVSFSSDTFLKSIGNSGPLGLGLFKLSFWSSSLQLLDANVPLREEERKIEDTWGPDLHDDEL